MENLIDGSFLQAKRCLAKIKEALEMLDPNGSQYLETGAFYFKHLAVQSWLLNLFIYSNCSEQASVTDFEEADREIDGSQMEWSWTQ